MGKDLHEKYLSVRELFEEAGDVLGFDLAAVCFQGPEEELSQTRITQPAIFVHSIAAFRLLQEKGFAPVMAAGHSLGEYSALVAAGYLSFSEGISLVTLRGQLMQKAGDRAPGTMAALIGLEDQTVKELCRESGEVVVPANFNAPGQVVISGTHAGVEKVMERAKAAGAKLVKKLNVSGAFHSPLMEYAVPDMKTRLAAVKMAKGRIPVAANVTGEIENDSEKLRDLLVRQITHPVRWTESIERMISSGVIRFVEVGPGSVLSGLCRRINKSVDVANVGGAEQVDLFKV
jgi:[acyl-carrier-protein] S-malonyltransferase